MHNGSKIRKEKKIPLLPHTKTKVFLELNSNSQTWIFLFAWSRAFCPSLETCPGPLISPFPGIDPCPGTCCPSPGSPLGPGGCPGVAPFCRRYGYSSGPPQLARNDHYKNNTVMTKFLLYLLALIVMFYKTMQVQGCGAVMPKII